MSRNHKKPLNARRTLVVATASIAVKGVNRRGRVDPFDWGGVVKFPKGSRAARRQEEKEELFSRDS